MRERLETGRAGHDPLGRAGPHRSRAGQAGRRRDPRVHGRGRLPGPPPVHDRAAVPERYRAWRTTCGSWARNPRRSPRSCARPPRKAVKVDLALRAVVAAEGLEATDEELEDEVVADDRRRCDVASRTASSQLRAGGQLSAVRSDIANRKALEWLVEHIEIVDPDGNPIPDELLMDTGPERSRSRPRSRPRPRPRDQAGLTGAPTP